ncbi:hypothetical protein L6R52_21755 [Myxococcota bacterium]|nr:hypothetical protein [Myxococcota bacterium]
MRALAFILLSSTAACGAGAAIEPPAGGTIVIGAGHDDGRAGFLALTDGSDLVVAPGSQGGFHVFLNVRLSAADMNPTNTLYLERRARRVSDDELVSQARHRVGFAPSPDVDGYFDTAAPFRLFLCPTPVGVAIRDATLALTIRAFVEERDTTPVAEGAVTFTPRCPDDDQRAFCEMICSG